MKPARGRPSVYNQDVADEICALIAEGRSLNSICKENEHFPSASAVRLWALDDREGFYAQYARAVELRMMAWVDELTDISDDSSRDMIRDPETGGMRFDHEHVQRSRLRLDTRKWLASKILPKVYGDKVSAEVTGKDGAPLMVPQLSIKIDRE